MRKKPDNSIAKCWQLLATKQVDGLVSSGNTGAVVAGGLFLRKFLKCVHRPGIATVMPTAKVTRPESIGVAAPAPNHTAPQREARAPKWRLARGSNSAAEATAASAPSSVITLPDRV